MRNAAICIIGGMTAFALAACTGSGTTVVTVTAPNSVTASGSNPSPSASASSVPPQSSEPSPSEEAPPMLREDEAVDALIASSDLKSIKALKEMELYGVDSYEAEVASDLTLKPSKCANVDGLIDSGAPSDPPIGVTSQAFFVQEEPFGYLSQAITPSAEAASALEYMYRDLIPQCQEYTKTTSSTFDNEVREKVIADLAWTEQSGWPTLSMTVLNTSRRSGDIGTGVSPSERRDWVLVTSVGPNLVSTSGTNEEGVTKLHALGVSRVQEARATASADGRSTAATTYRS